MAGMLSVRQVSCRELLDMRQEQWGRKLRCVSLAAEAEISDAQCAQVASALGRLYKKGGYAGSEGAAFLMRWPACLVAAMTSVAVTGYEQGTYWPALWKATGYTGGAADQQAWGTAFARAVSRLGLPTFSHSPLPYLGPILMHAGIPVYCLGDYLRLLLERSRH